MTTYTELCQTLRSWVEGRIHDHGALFVTPTEYARLRRFLDEIIDHDPEGAAYRLPAHVTGALPPKLYDSINVIVETPDERQERLDRLVGVLERDFIDRSSDLRRKILRPMPLPCPYGTNELDGHCGRAGCLFCDPGVRTPRDEVYVVHAYEDLEAVQNDSSTTAVVRFFRGDRAVGEVTVPPRGIMVVEHSGVAVTVRWEDYRGGEVVLKKRRRP